MVVRNAAPTGAASLLLASNNQNGVAELVVLSGGGVQLNSFQQFISFNNTSGLANMAIEPNIGGQNNGEVIFACGFTNLSDRAVKENIRAIPCAGQLPAARSQVRTVGALRRQGPQKGCSKLQGLSCGLRLLDC